MSCLYYGFVVRCNDLMLPELRIQFGRGLLSELADSLEANCFIVIDHPLSSLSLHCRIVEIRLTLEGPLRDS